MLYPNIWRQALRMQFRLSGLGSWLELSLQLTPAARKPNNPQIDSLMPEAQLPRMDRNGPEGDIPKLDPLSDPAFDNSRQDCKLKAGTQASLWVNASTYTVFNTVYPHVKAFFTYELHTYTPIRALYHYVLCTVSPAVMQTGEHAGLSTRWTYGKTTMHIKRQNDRQKQLQIDKRQIGRQASRQQPGRQASTQTKNICAWAHACTHADIHMSIRTQTCMFDVCK